MAFSLLAVVFLPLAGYAQQAPGVPTKTFTPQKREFGTVTITVKGKDAANAVVKMVMPSGVTDSDADEETHYHVLIPHQFEHGETAGDRAYTLDVEYHLNTTDDWELDHTAAPGIKSLLSEDNEYSAGPDGQDPAPRVGQKEEEIPDASRRLVVMQEGMPVGDRDEEIKSHRVRIFVFTPGIAIRAYDSAAFTESGLEIPRPTEKGSTYTLVPPFEPAPDLPPLPPLDGSQTYIKLNLRFQPHSNQLDLTQVYLTLPGHVQGWDFEGNQLPKNSRIQVDGQGVVTVLDGPASLATATQPSGADVWVRVDIQNSSNWSRPVKWFFRTNFNGIGRGTGDEVVVGPLELAPSVLPVNSNFDEGVIDEPEVESVSYAMPDSETGTLKAARDHLDGKWKKGEIVTEDLHKGFFGLRPGTLPFNDTNGAVVKIRKLEKVDPQTGQNESGHVRLYAVYGTQGSESEVLIELYDKDTLEADDIGPLLYSAPLGENVEYYLEGVAPGKITLEFSYVNGSTKQVHEQRFLVATLKSREQWREEIRYQIRLQESVIKTAAIPGNFHTDIAKLDPRLGFRDPHPEKDNSRLIALMYYYYAQLYLEQDDLFLWPGMARTAASSIYAGMTDMYVWNTNPITGGDPEAVRFVNEFLIPGMQAIFEDLAWAHRAYAASGIWAIRHVADVEGEAVDLDAWELLDKGILGDDISDIRESSRRLLDREQNSIIQPYYAAIGAVRFKPPGHTRLGWIAGVEVGLDEDGKAEIGEWMSANAVENPIDGYNPKEPGEIYGPLSFRSVVPGGRLDKANDRWAWITHPELGMLPRWIGTSTAEERNYSADIRTLYCVQRLRTTARRYSMMRGFLPPW